MAESPERKAAVSEVAVRLWPCARPLECGLVLPHDKHDRNKFSSQVSAPVSPALADRRPEAYLPLQELRKLLLYAKAKHKKSYPWLR